MTTANWITVVVTLVAMAVTWGEVRARLKAVEKLANKTQEDATKSLAAQGARIGRLEDRTARIEGAIWQDRMPRRLTRGGGIPIATESETTGGDES